MEIYYKERKEGLEVFRVHAAGGVLKLPGKLPAGPVYAVAPYGFSDRGDEDETRLSCYRTEDREGEENLPCRGRALREIHLPAGVERIGNYAFYGCRNLSLFHGTDSIVHMGSGVFTGCRLSRVQMDFYQGEKSCLKEILTEIRYQVTAELYCRAGEKRGMAKVVFPEYYADAVENTPARIVETHYYGSGGDYRECFYRRELDFGKYDRMFPLSEARDEEEVTLNLALARLLWPWKLQEKARSQYRDYLREHTDAVTGLALRQMKSREEPVVAESREILGLMCREGLLEGPALEEALMRVAEAEEPELLGILMEYRQKQTGGKKKTFEL